MQVKFTKMQGAGNDFVVLDATRAPLQLSREQLRHLGDRRFGVGADQILVVEPARSADADFGYRIFNNTGDEVEHCGNGARCFVRFVHDHGLTTKPTVTRPSGCRCSCRRLLTVSTVTVGLVVSPWSCT